MAGEKQIYILNNYSEKLKKLRGNISQEKISKALGISQSLYAMFETGARRPSDEMKIRMAAYYNKGIEELFYK